MKSVIKISKLKKVSGIYRIVSPIGRSYVGQSRDLAGRYWNHKIRRAENNPRLRASFDKYGLSEHIFEVLEFCSRDELDQRESFYISDLQSTGDFGLNCNTGGVNGFIVSEITKAKISALKINRFCSEATKQKCREANIGRVIDPEWVAKANESRSHIILNMQTGIYYYGVRDAAHSINLDCTVLSNALNGKSDRKVDMAVVYRYVHPKRRLGYSPSPPKQSEEGGTGNG